MYRVGLGLMSLVFILVSATAFSQTQSREDDSELPLEDLRNFTSVFDQIRRGYVENITDAQLLEYAIRGMVAELDPHSAYLSKDAYTELQSVTSGEFAGVGLEVSIEHGMVKVIAPIDEGPSARAGIQSGDVIIRVDDEAVKSMDLNEAVRHLRGPKGTSIKLTVLREGAEQPLDFVLERDIIKVKSVRTRLFDDDYFYIRLSQFQINTGTELAQQVRVQLEKNPALKGIILDLRNNPGGVVQASVEVADTFLDGGRVVFTRGRLRNSNVTYNAANGDITHGLPMVVLINDGSASASEIVAGALQDHGRAIIMGTRSFGKGSVQSVIPLENDRAIKLTTALYYTPKGRSIQAEGIEPDVIVERVKTVSINEPQRLTEADLAKHLSINKDTESTHKTRAQTRITRLQLLKDDNQLQEALNLLKGLTIYRHRTSGSAASSTSLNVNADDSLTAEIQ